MKKITHLFPLFKFVITALIILSISRLFLCIVFWDRVSAVDNWYNVFLIGVRMDMILISYACFLPLLLLSFSPSFFFKKTNLFLRWYFILILFYFIFMELTTYNFIAQYDTRPNRIFIEYLIYPKEVFGMLEKGFLGAVIAVILLSFIALLILYRVTKKWFLNKPYLPSYPYRIIVFIFFSGIFFTTARSSFNPRAVSPSAAAFSPDQMVNSLALNSGYSLYYAGYLMKNDKNSVALYGAMPLAEAYDVVKQEMHIDPRDFVSNSKSPLLHRQTPLKTRLRPLNIVILLQESLGAEFVGCLGGLPLTPNIDRLSKEGQLLTNLYATGTRSVRGIEAVTTGFFPTASRSIVKRSNAQTGFFTLASLLKANNYKTSFIYGGSADFDNMGAFFSGNGFQKIIDQKDYKNYVFKGNWGVSDEDLMRKANETFVEYGDAPFFSLVFSSSNHTPFEFPDGRIKRYDKQKQTVNNAIKYADYALGKFFEMAKKEDYYKRTIFIIVADHNTRTYGNMLVPIHKFHIPALIIGPDVPEKPYEKLCSQLDLPPTLLDYAGIPNENPMPGRNLRQLPRTVPGRAIMQFGYNNAYLEASNQVLIMQPHLPAQTFLYDKANRKLTQQPDNKTMERKAKASIVVASDLYNHRRYTLPKKEQP